MGIGYWWDTSGIPPRRDDYNLKNKQSNIQKTLDIVDNMDVSKNNSKICKYLFNIADNYEEYNEMCNDDIIKSIVNYYVNNNKDKIKLVKKVCEELLEIGKIY